MALCKRSICLVALMVVVMATVMLSCHAGPAPGEWCESIGDGCSPSKCRGRCGSLGFTNRFYCEKETNRCCCDMSGAKQKNVVHPSVVIEGL